MSPDKSSAPRQVISVRLNEEELGLLKRIDRNISRAIRRLIHGPEPAPSLVMPSIGDAIAAGARVTFTDASGTYEVAPSRVPLSQGTWPPLSTVVHGPYHMIFEVST